MFLSQLQLSIQAAKSAFSAMDCHLDLNLSELQFSWKLQEYECIDRIGEFPERKEVEFERKRLFRIGDNIFVEKCLLVPLGKERE